MAMIQKILLVDDIPENLFSLESILEEEGREFLKAASGEEALKILLKTNDIDLILLDVQMPGMDGFETAQLIRGSKKTRHIPIIFVTAISKEQKNIFKGYEAGAVDYMFKPLEPTIVQSKVKIFLELAAQRRMLQQQNTELIAAKRNTDNIFENVEQGIFLIGQDLIIKPQYSRSLSQMLSQDDLKGRNLLELLKSGLDEKLKQSIEDYLHLLFNEDIDEKDLVELNPLWEMPFKPQNAQDTKYLSFKFKRIYIDDELAELIVTVSDHTQRVTLKSQLQKVEAQSQRNLELVKILDMEPSLVREFLEQTDQDLKKAGQLIKEKDRSPETVEYIYRIIHSIKGNASLLGMKLIADKTHRIEEIVLSLDIQPTALDDRTEELQKMFKELFQILNELHQLIDKMKHFQKYFDRKSGYEGNILIKAFSNLLENLGREYGRSFRFDYKEFDISLIPEGKLLLIKDIMIQLFRNAAIHSYQSPEERKKLGKPAEITMSLATKKENGNLKIVFEDDGRGLQYEKIKQKAIETKKITPEEIEKMDKTRIGELIFHSGITTAGKADLTAGRGVGMNVIKSKLEEAQGKIEIESEEGKFCRFKITLPLNRELN